MARKARQPPPGARSSQPKRDAPPPLANPRQPNRALLATAAVLFGLWLVFLLLLVLSLR